MSPPSILSICTIGGHLSKPFYILPLASFVGKFVAKVVQVDREASHGYHTPGEKGLSVGRFAISTANTIRTLMTIDGTSQRRSSVVRVAALAVFLPLAFVACSGPFPQSTLHPTSDFAVAIDDLYRIIFWFAVAVFVFVEGLLVFVVVRYRAKPGGEAKHVHGSTALEIAWTLAPAVVLVFIAVPTMQTIFQTEGAVPDGALEVEVIGHQWWWEFKYPELGITTANELHLPQGRAVVLAMSSADVIHSFWVPKLAGKRDVMPGRTSRLMFTPDSTGPYLGQCAEFCGESHANMRFRVMVDPSETFEQWTAAQLTAPTPVDSLTGRVRQGAEAFQRVRTPANHSCVACHAIEGVSFGVLGPNLSHVASRTTIASGILPNTTEGLTRWLRDPVGEKPGSLMPNIELTEDEIAALVAYLQSLN